MSKIEHTEPPTQAFNERMSERSKYYHDRAVEILAWAQNARSEDAKHIFLVLAEDYQRLEQKAEEKDAPGGGGAR